MCNPEPNGYGITDNFCIERGGRLVARRSIAGGYSVHYVSPRVGSEPPEQVLVLSTHEGKTEFVQAMEAAEERLSAAK